jgi:hypothetical protein
MTTELQKIEERLRAIERAQSRVTGGLIALGAIGITNLIRVFTA